VPASVSFVAPSSVSTGASSVALYNVSEPIRLSLQHTTTQNLPWILCQLDAHCCLARHSAPRFSGFDIIRALRPPELLVGEEDSESRKEEAKDADYQGGDPVLVLH
jgi:hypothetical protein